MDRGYSTIDLFKIMLQKKIYAVGTIKKYKNLPSVIRKAKPLKGRGTGANDEELADDDDEDTLTVDSEYSVDPVSEQQTADEECKGEIDFITALVISSATTLQTADNAFLISSAPPLISGSSSTSTSNNNDLGTHKGQWIWMAKSLDRDHKLIATAWHDSGICLALSTRHGNEGSRVLRRAKGFQNRIERTCPELIDFYNSWMGGVDRADSLRAHLTTIRRCKKWWHALWHYVIDTAFMNSAILAEKCGFVIKDRSAFLHELICELVNDNGARSSRRTRSLIFDPPLPHYQNRFDKRGNCIVCYNSTKKISTTQYVYCNESSLLLKLWMFSKF